jgi:hypothetical protein
MLHSLATVQEKSCIGKAFCLGAGFANPFPDGKDRERLLQSLKRPALGFTAKWSGISDSSGIKH